MLCRVFVNPWWDRAVEAVGHSDVLRESQWPHFLATCLHKRKGHSNLDIKSLLGPWWHWLWHAYQRTACDMYVVEFILIRSCRRMYEEWEKRSRGKKSGNMAAFFYQEYANRCMQEGYNSGMWISSSGTTVHANVLIVHFARRICHMPGWARPRRDPPALPCTACLFVCWSRWSTSRSVGFTILRGSSWNWEQQKHCEIIQIHEWEEENKGRFWCFSENQHNPL